MIKANVDPDSISFNEQDSTIRISFQSHIEPTSEGLDAVKAVILEALARFEADDDDERFAARAIAWDILRDR